MYVSSFDQYHSRIKSTHIINGLQYKDMTLRVIYAIIRSLILTEYFFSFFFLDEEDEENEYGKILQRMREKYNYLSEKCVAVGKDLSCVRKRLDGSWSVSESKAQPEEVLRQEVREVLEVSF